MTCIAWDGTTLAGDKRACNVGLARTVTKIHRAGDYIVGFAGDANVGVEMVEWVRSGMDREKYPEIQKDKSANVHLLVIDKDGSVMVYESGAYPVRFEDKFIAIGCGRDYAIAAMHCGRTAREAVEIACLYETSCGNGVDTLRLR